MGLETIPEKIIPEIVDNIAIDSLGRLGHQADRG